MRNAFALIPLTAAAFVFAAGSALASSPEIERPLGTPQANGVTHLVRGIPEACAWLQGTFTGDASNPYRFAPARSSASCQARARIVDFDKAQPSEAKGWKLNDRIRVPSQACPSMTAVVEVWRKVVAVSAPKLDAQGRARIYLQDAKASAGKKVPMTVYSAKATVEGKPCG